MRGVLLEVSERNVFLLAFLSRRRFVICLIVATAAKSGKEGSVETSAWVAQRWVKVQADGHPQWHGPVCGSHECVPVPVARAVGALRALWASGLCFARCELPFPRRALPAAAQEEEAWKGKGLCASPSLRFLHVPIFSAGTRLTRRGVGTGPLGRVGLSEHFRACLPRSRRALV